MVLFEAVDGVLALVTVVAPPGASEPARTAALEIAASIRFGGTAEQLLDAIELPEPLPFTPV